jgi:hypothetical protein
MYWVELAQERDRWLCLVNAVVKLRIPQNALNFVTELSNFQLPKDDLTP